MIERYTRPAMGKIWSDEHRLTTMLRVEEELLKALAPSKGIPASQYCHQVGRNQSLPDRRIIAIQKPCMEFRWPVYSVVKSSRQMYTFIHPRATTHARIFR